MQISEYRSQDGRPMGYFPPQRTPILWVIFTDLHGFATRGALMESGQFNDSIIILRNFKFDFDYFHDV